MNPNEKYIRQLGFRFDSITRSFYTKDGKVEITMDDVKFMRNKPFKDKVNELLRSK